ncbi:MAG: hypothetical protein PQJ46_11445 [Spirochaetales bacterium]|nr:hypothetical protein [Spirochaetales bacterium]
MIGGRFLFELLRVKNYQSPIGKIGLFNILAGAFMMFFSSQVLIGGFLLTGLGCGSVFSFLINEVHFRINNDLQGSIGAQIVMAYAGMTFLPPFFGFTAGLRSMHLFPLFLIACLLIIMICFYRLRKLSERKQSD